MSHVLLFSLAPVAFSRPVADVADSGVELGRTQAPLDLWAFGIMPEHVYLGQLPRENARILAILTTIKQSVVKRAILQLKHEAPNLLQRIEDVPPEGKRRHRF